MLRKGQLMEATVVATMNLCPCLFECKQEFNQSESNNIDSHTGDARNIEIRNSGFGVPFI